MPSSPRTGYAPSPAETTDTHLIRKLDRQTRSRTGHSPDPKRKFGDVRVGPHNAGGCRFTKDAGPLELRDRSPAPGLSGRICPTKLPSVRLGYTRARPGAAQVTDVRISKRPGENPRRSSGCGVERRRNTGRYAAVGGSTGDGADRVDRHTGRQVRGFPRTSAVIGSQYLCPSGCRKRRTDGDNANASTGAGFCLNSRTRIHSGHSPWLPVLSEVAGHR